MMKLFFDEISKQPVEKVDVMAMPEAVIWRNSAEYMF